MTPDRLHQVFILLVAFQIKHYLADFPLQFEFMVKEKSRSDWGFIKPLTLHCSVHGALTLLIILVVNASLWWLCLVDFCMHFTMDRIKSSPRFLGRFNKVTSSAFWNCFGFDQMFHHMTHYFIIGMLITGGAPQYLT